MPQENKFVKLPISLLMIGGMVAGFGMFEFIKDLLNPIEPTIVFRAKSEPYPTHLIDGKCYIRQRDLTEPHEDLVPDFKLIGIFVDSKGQLVRKTYGARLEALLAGIDIENDASLNTLLVNNTHLINQRKVEVADKFPNNAPLNPGRIGISTKLKKHETDKPDYTKISYVLLNDAWTFNESRPYMFLNTPQHPMVSPFIDQSEGKDTDDNIKVITFTYYAHTGDFQGSFTEHAGKKCKYALNLYVDISEKNTAHTNGFELSTPIIIDPIIQNNGLP